MPIVWRDKLNTGNNIIDRDHKYLFCLFNSIELSTTHPDLLKHLPTFLGQLFDYTKEHFQREEVIQAKVRYPDQVRHRGLHADILAQLQEVRTKVDKMMSEPGDEAERWSANQELITGALELARDWIVDHVIKVDCTMIPYLSRYSANLE